MTRWIGPACLAAAYLAGSQAADAQSARDRMGGSLGRGLPFSTLPERLQGPPRGEGELPFGRSQPPSDMSGRGNEPPIADGYAPGFYRSPSTGPMVNPFSLPRDLMGPLPGQDRRFPFGRYAFPGLPEDEMGAVGSMEALIPPAEGDAGAIQPLTLPPESSLREVESPLIPRPPTPDTQPTFPPLGLGEVLASAERFYPPYLAFLQERAVADGELLTAVGGFDLGVNLDARNWALGYYKRYLYDFFVDQPTTLWGTRFFAGYRLAAGDWPPYYQYLQTNGGGAYVAGLELPFLRGGRIDERRAVLYQAEIDRRRVEPDISRQRILLFNQAAKAYWAWLAAGKSYAVFERLLKLAEDRIEGLEEQVARGAEPAFNLVDNQRVLLQRRQLLVAARQDFQQAAVNLSLFARDRYGLPLVPQADRLPGDFPPVEPPNPERLEEDVRVALRLRPELPDLRFQAQRINVDRDLARNQMLPGLNLYVYTEQNVGAPVPLRNKQPFILESSLLFDVPLQRRQARGRIRSAEGQLSQIALRERFATEQIAVEVKNAMIALEALHEQMIQKRLTVQANQRLEEGERAKFPAASTILLVFFREEQTAQAEVDLIDAEARYFDALADYRAALGVDALPPQGFFKPARQHRYIP